MLLMRDTWSGVALKKKKNMGSCKVSLVASLIFLNVKFNHERELHFTNSSKRGTNPVIFFLHLVSLVFTSFVALLPNCT